MKTIEELKKEKEELKVKTTALEKEISELKEPIKKLMHQLRKDNKRLIEVIETINNYEEVKKQEREKELEKEVYKWLGYEPSIGPGFSGVVFNNQINFSGCNQPKGTLEEINKILEEKNAVGLIVSTKFIPSGGWGNYTINLQYLEK